MGKTIKQYQDEAKVRNVELKKLKIKLAEEVPVAPEVLKKVAEYDELLEKFKELESSPVNEVAADMIKRQEKRIEELEALNKQVKVTVDADKCNSPEEFNNQLVMFTAFSDTNEYRDDLIQRINGKRHVVPRGKTVMIPRFVAMAILDGDRQRGKADKSSLAMVASFEAQNA